MSDTEPRKRMSGLKIFGIIVAGLVVVLIVAVIGMRVAAGHRQARLEQKLKAEVAALRARSAVRPTLSGAAEPGNAWDDYDAALTEFKTLSSSVKLGTILSDTHDDKPDGALSKLPTFMSPIARLRQGARRAESRKDYAYEQGLSAPNPPLLACSQLSAFALLHARTLVKEGKTGDAVAEILDVAQFGRDLAAEGLVISYMIGISASAQALVEVRDLLTGGSLDPASRATLIKGLETAAAGFPSFEDATHRERLGFEYFMINEASSNLFVGMLYMNAAHKAREMGERSAAASRVSWAQALNEDAAIQAELSKSWNPIVKMTAVSFTQSAGKGSRQQRAHLHLLLAGLQYQSGTKVSDLDDPFGTKLLSSETEGKLKIWSVGPDGVDDKGSGTWKPHEGKDIVIEVPRK